MMAHSRERGYVTHDELNGVLPPGEIVADRIADRLTVLPGLGIATPEGGGSEEDAGGRRLQARARG